MTYNTDTPTRWGQPSSPAPRGGLDSPRKFFPSTPTRGRHDDTAMPNDGAVRSPAGPAFKGYNNSAFVDEPDFTSGHSGLMASPSHTAGVRGQRTGSGSSGNEGPPASRARHGSENNYNNTWGSSASASKPTGVFGAKRHSATNANNGPTQTDVEEICAFEDEVVPNNHSGAYNYASTSAQPYAQQRGSSPTFDGQASLRSSQSNQSSAAGRRRVQSQAVHVWEAETHNLIRMGSHEDAVSRPAPSTGMIQCRIQVEKSMFGKTSIVRMYMENGDVFLLAARKRKKSKATNFVMSTDENDLAKDSPHCTAKFRANFMGTEYTLCSRSHTTKGEHDREEISVGFKQVMFTAVPGPRVMMVASPLPEISWAPQEKDGSDNLAACLEKARLRELGPAKERQLTLLGNKPPEWDERAKAHTLDFLGRVKMSSVKNFQLVTWDHNSDAKGADLLLQFGKVDEHHYILDFSYPLTPKRAFAIALASLDTKLAYAL